MFTASLPLILASASPRRREFLAGLGLAFTVLPASVDETPMAGESPWAFVRRMAAAKANSVAAGHPQACVLGTDTVVALEGTIFGKPRDAEEALAILTTLQGRTHEVSTGFAVVARESGIAEVDVCTTRVSFAAYDQAILRAYVDSGEPMDKAGAYGIQGRGSFLIRSIEGSCTNVIGLPVEALLRTLLAHGLISAG